MEGAPTGRYPTRALQTWVLLQHRPLTNLHHVPVKRGDAAYKQSMGSD